MAEEANAQAEQEPEEETTDEALDEQPEDGDDELDADDEDEDLDDGEGDDEEEDALDALVEVSENATSDHKRVGEYATELRASLEEKHQALQAVVSDESADPGMRSGAELHLVQMNATLFLLDEVGETLLSLLDSLATASADNAAHVRNWAENEVEPALDDLEAGGVAGGPQLAPQDVMMVVEIIDQYCAMLNQGIAEHTQDSQEYAIIHGKITQVLALRERVQQQVSG